MKRRNGILLALLPVLLAGCAPAPPAQEETNKEVARTLIEAVNTRDYDLLDEIVAPDFVRHCQATPDARVRSLADMKEYLRKDAEVFPDSRVTAETIIAEGDMVAGYLTFSGTQQGPIGPFPATGKKMELVYLSMMRFEAGKIVEMWVEWDNLAILRQLGHWPVGPAAEE